MKKILLGLIVTLVVTLEGCNTVEKEKEIVDIASDYSDVEHIDSFDGVLTQAESNYVVYYYSANCGYCNLIKDYVLEYASDNNVDIKVYFLDADNVTELVALFKEEKPFLVINVALPYQDLTIMDACLATGVHYLDTANYEPKDVAKFEYSWQWAYQERFKKAGLMALLGCGFDPGVTGVYTAYANKHYFDEMHFLDIIDCNAGDHGKAFATNFNPEINIREITQKGKYWENGEWVEIDAMSIHKPISYPNIGPKESYLLYHEELESLVKNFPTIKRARFWMTFGQAYLTHLEVLQNVGMTSIHPIKFNGLDIVPLEFLKAVLPEPGTLGENYLNNVCSKKYV